MATCDLSIFRAALLAMALGAVPAAAVAEALLPSETAAAVAEAPLPSEIASERLAEAQWSDPVAVGQGVAWRWTHFEDLFGAPLFVSVVEADLGHPEVRVGMAFLREGEALQRVHALAPEQFPGAAAAINASFFNMRPPFGTVCYLRVGGEEIAPETRSPGSSANNGAVAIGADGRVWIEASRPRDGWASLDEPRTLLAAGPVVVRGGDTRDDLGRFGSFCEARHPRSLVGLCADGRRLLLVALDGRAEESAGATCAEAAAIMEALGAHTALNLDGGGSTTLWVRGGHGADGVVNHPSDNRTFDHRGARVVADAIVVTAPAAE